MRYEKVTEGIRVRVEPHFSLPESSPADGTFVFAYHIEIANEGEEAGRLLYRHWLIHDSAGEDTEVDGEGVVGLQPLIDPGESHRYRSYCVLHSASGTMEGHYTFERPGGRRFRVEVPRFDLLAPFMVSTDEGDDEVVH
jgi:ApaG protein